MQPGNLKICFESERLKEITLILRQQKQEAYLVGGAVRDALLDRLDANADLDLVVPTNALQIARKLADQLQVAYYPVDPQREVGRVVWPDQTHIDIATYRGETLFEDLRLRDFTINAIALQLDQPAPKIIDPLSGQTDLAQKVIRATSENALGDDPLRTVRAVRFAAHFGFTLTPETETWVSEQASGLKTVSPERLRDEMVKLLQANQAGRAVAHLKDLGVLPHILPQAMAMVGVEQSLPHQLSVFEHTLRVLDCMPLLALDDDRLDFLAPIGPQLQAYFQTELAGNLSRASLMPLAALLHDIGKPQTFKRGSDGRIRFWNHPQVGAKVATNLMKSWRFSAQAIRFVTTIVRNHMRPLLLAHQKAVSRRAVHRFLEATATAAPAVAIFSLLDHLGTFASETAQVEEARLAKVALHLCQAYFAPKLPTLLTGREVMDHLKLSSGPAIGLILRQLKEAQAIGQLTTKEEAFAFIEQIAESVRRSLKNVQK